MHRPTPCDPSGAITIDRSQPPAEWAERLRAGRRLKVVDAYGTGADVLAELRRQLRPLPASAPYEARQAHRRRYREASLCLLAPVRGHRLDLAGADKIGFLAELYPDTPELWLPFVELQELYGAWTRYAQGVPLAVLGRSLHPFYGTYVPTRTSHLELFATWLSGWDGPRDLAVDVGTGCGVLAMMLARAGFGRVVATDDNPNAIESVRRELVRQPAAIEPVVCDLLSGTDGPLDLVVFNPPWIRGEVEGLVDRALYFVDGDLFERFFDQAIARLAPHGRIAVLFSNVITLVQPDEPHPLETELARARLRLVSKTRRKVAASHGRRTREKVEVWELALA